jgi:hypothetical protein
MKKKKKIVVKDRMQENYVYELSESAGNNFREDFIPELTPKQMLELGVFGGVYMRDCIKEFPKTWFDNAKFQKKGSYKHEASLNFFEVNASQSLSIWREKGWLHKDDPRGWFQWYCRYYVGRRHEDDGRQIKRWKQMKRHLGQVKKNCRAKDFGCRRKQRQALLHWAYDSRMI